MTSTLVLPATRVGQTLGGRFAVQAQIGQGAFATVYRARDQDAGHDVVVKVLASDADAHAVERFQRERALSQRVAHRGVCRVLDLFEEREGAQMLRWLTMELVAGRTLGDAMNEGVMHPARALRLVRALADVVAATHAAGIVHGDLKPSNVMLRKPMNAAGDDDEEPVVLDFGAAVEMNGQPAGRTLGSLRYVAPELLKGRAPSAQTDIYALGVILYAALTHVFPHDAADDLGVQKAVLKDTALPPSTHAPYVPALVDAVVLRAIARKTCDRFDDVRAFSAALDDALASLHPPSSWWSRLLPRVR